MSKPTTIPTFATAAGATLDPGETIRLNGFTPGRKLPAKWLNWLFNQQGGWFSYLQNLHIEPEYLNKVYGWTGAHAFQSTVGFYGVPVLCNGQELRYGDNVGNQITPDRTVVIPHTSFTSEITISVDLSSGAVYTPPGWRWLSGAGNNGTGFGWTSIAQGQKLVGTFHVPTGSRLKNVTASISLRSDNPSGGYIYMDAGLFDSATGLAFTEALEQTRRADPGKGNVSVDVTKPYQGSNPQTVNAATHLGYVEFAAYGGTFGSVHSVKATFSDPGPRNY